MHKSFAIFIGGTGRCGTNILKESLCNHPEICGLNFETRFTIDPRGVIPAYISLKDHRTPLEFDRILTDLYHFINQLAKINRLDKLSNILESLLRNCIREKGLRAYSHWELEKYFPKLRSRTSLLIDTISSGSYKGSWHGNNIFRNSMFLPSSQSDVVDAFSVYMTSLIGDILEINDCKVYVDDNTFNILYSPELCELVPDCVIVHLYRDPRDVVASYLKQRWSPNDLDQAIEYYTSIMEKWANLKSRVPSKQMTEIKFESFVLSPEIHLKEIIKRYPIKKDVLVGGEVDTEKANIGRWQREFTKSQKRNVNKKLGSWINCLGYSV